MPSNSSQITVTPARMLPDVCLSLHSTRSAAETEKEIITRWQVSNLRLQLKENSHDGRVSILQ